MPGRAVALYLSEIEICSTNHSVLTALAVPPAWQVPVPAGVQVVFPPVFPVPSGMASSDESERAQLCLGALWSQFQAPHPPWPCERGLWPHAGTQAWQRRRLPATALVPGAPAAAGVAPGNMGRLCLEWPWKCGCGALGPRLRRATVPTGPVREKSMEMRGLKPAPRARPVSGVAR